ncbi:DUF4365 domain-containing protein [Streptomyces europaeiscabiei]|uniref:DUF4365 domain-containing protein n=1 Tax=Streptomyces europaeiscabiei TaxID=146819 RepID=UPI000628488B|nr:DUF4365 domain-containing protein [Streptomyces europaeiscabiei]
MSDAASWQKERASYAHLLWLATQAGYRVADWTPDIDGVDATLRDGGLMVDLQLKCTMRPRVVDGDYAFDLDVATYNKLRDPLRSAPGYLALMIIDPDIEKWIVHDPQGVSLAVQGYWAVLQDEPPPVGKKRTAIRLPRHQVLDKAALDAMFDFSREMAQFGLGRGARA